MALPLLPPLEAGETRARREALLGYADLDFYGVQSAPVATTDDMRGPNEEFRFLRDVYSFLDAEHDANGAHDTFQIARLYLAAYWDGTNYIVDPASYVMGATFRSDSSAFTLTSTATGEIKVVLDAAYTLPNATYLGGMDRWTSDRSWEDEMVKVRLTIVTDAVTFYVKRWAGSSAASLALTNGPFVIAVHAEA